MKKATEDMILEQLFHLTRKVDKIQEVMATKEDIKAIRAEMATKEDLKNYATKEDIKAIRAEMATKEDLKNFVTKEQLEEEFSKQSKEIAQIFHNTFATMEKRQKEAEQRIFNKVQKETEQRILSKVQVELEKFANHKISC